MESKNKLTASSGRMPALVQLLRNWTDARRQAEINRLVTRAARRCSRDFAHAIDHIPDDDPNKANYVSRLKRWQEIFWDCAAYRDSMHHEIWGLESKVEKLEKQLRAAGIQPETELPF